MGSQRFGIGVFSVNCSDFSPHNRAVLRLRRLGQRGGSRTGTSLLDTYFSASKVRAHLPERAKQQRALAT